MKIIKELYKENGILAILFGIVATIWISPVAILFLLAKFIIELPLKFIFKKFRTNRPFKNA